MKRKLSILFILAFLDLVMLYNSDKTQVGIHILWVKMAMVSRLRGDDDFVFEIRYKG